MSISITLPDDAKAHELLAAQIFFKQLADHAIAEERSETAPRFQVGSGATAVRLGDPGIFQKIATVSDPETDSSQTIAPEDNPEAGVTPTVTTPQPVDDSPTAEDAAAAFGTPTPPPLPTVTAAGAAVGLPVNDAEVPAAEVDKTGLPWDERIHSSGANKLNADGTWRKRRGVNEIDYKRIEAELRGAAPAPSVPTPPVPQPPNLTVVPPAPFVPPAAPNVPPPPTVSASPVPSPGGSAPTTFAQIAGLIGPMMAPKGALTQEMIAKAMGAHGLGPGLPLLAASQDKIPAVWQSIQNILQGQQP